MVTQLTMQAVDTVDARPAVCFMVLLWVRVSAIATCPALRVLCAVC